MSKVRFLCVVVLVSIIFVIQFYMPSVVQRHYSFSSVRNVNLSLENLTNLFEEIGELKLLVKSKESTISSNNNNEVKFEDHLNGSVEKTYVDQNSNETGKESNPEEKRVKEAKAVKENKNESVERAEVEKQNSIENVKNTKVENQNSSEIVSFLHKNDINATRCHT